MRFADNVGIQHEFFFHLHKTEKCAVCAKATRENWKHKFHLVSRPPPRRWEMKQQKHDRASYNFRCSCTWERERGVLGRGKIARVIKLDIINSSNANNHRAFSIARTNFLIHSRRVIMNAVYVQCTCLIYRNTFRRLVALALFHSPTF